MSESRDNRDTDRPPAPVDAPPPGKPRVLVADDERALAAAVSRVLSAAGYEITVASDGNEAMQQLMASGFDVIVSDINMPGASGVDVLRVARAYDLDVPVILMTGAPEVATAMQAVELGALQYLTKPVAEDTLLRAVKRALNLHRVAKVKREALRALGRQENAPGDRAGLEAAFDRALEGLKIALQPIVSVRGRRVVAYEALMRSDEPALPSPAEVLDAAERLDRLHDVGRRVRKLGADALRSIPDGIQLWVNLHPHDLLDPTLADGRSPLGEAAHRVVLELTERASLDGIGDLEARVSILRYLGFKFAIDDLGAGYAGLGAFSRLEPDIVKVDMSLVHDIHTSQPRQRVFRALLALSDELGATLVAEGIEARDEETVVRELGCDLMQGYLYARPGFGLPDVNWR